MNRTSSERVHAAVIRLLREERLSQGLSMYHVAPKAGLHQSALGLIETGKRNPTLATLLRVSEVLGIELGQIIIRATENVRAGNDLQEAKSETQARAKRAK